VIVLAAHDHRKISIVLPMNISLPEAIGLHFAVDNIVAPIAVNQDPSIRLRKKTKP
jgi:hypothetical protein